jgi:predicted PurR-regulated permease PerM
MSNLDKLTQPAIELTIRILLVLFLVCISIYLLAPFLSIVLWAGILAMATYPLFVVLVDKLKGRKGWAATSLVIVGLIIVIIPTFLFYESIIDGLYEVKDRFDAGTLGIPAPPEGLNDIPVLRKIVYPPWEALSTNFNQFVVSHKDLIHEHTGQLFSSLLSIGGGVLQMIVSIIIAGIFLVNTGAADTGRRVIRQLMGERGDRCADMINQTVLSVVKGVVGVAVIQGFLAGVAFLLAGIPSAGLWALLVFLFALLQLPPVLIMIPVIIGLYAEMSLVAAIAWTVVFVLIGGADNILKPLLLGKGAPVPMLVIFFGVIGGFVAFSFMGLFVGAIILSIAYKLFEVWLEPAS